MSQTVNLSLWDQIELDHVNRNTKRAANAANAAAAASAYQAAMQRQTTQAINTMQQQIQATNVRLDAIHSQQVIANLMNAQNFVASHPMPADKTKAAVDYMFGRNGIASNQFIAYVYMKMAAAEGSMVANYYMGDLVLNGSVYPSNLQLALDYYSIYVNIYIQQFCTTLEDVNDVASNFFNGNNLPQNDYVAFLFWKQIESYNNTRALNNLGNCYHYGRGTTQDISKALSYYQKAAELGNKTYSLNRIGVLYWDSGKMENKKLAIAYWEKAAYNGSKDASENLAKNYKDTREELIFIPTSLIILVINFGLMFLSEVRVRDKYYQVHHPLAWLAYIAAFVFFIVLIRLIVKLFKNVKTFHLLRLLRATSTLDGVSYTPTYKGDTVIVTCNVSQPTTSTTNQPVLPSEVQSQTTSQTQTPPPSGPQTMQ